MEPIVLTKDQLHAITQGLRLRIHQCKEFARRYPDELQYWQQEIISAELSLEVVEAYQ